MSELIQIRNTSLSQYQDCPRKWYWGYGYRRGEQVDCERCGGFGSGNFDDRSASGSSCPDCRGRGKVRLAGGIEPLYSRLELSIGSGVHKGIEMLLKGRPIWTAVDEARADYMKEMGLDYLVEIPIGPREYSEVEGYHLVEALIRAFEKVYLPSLLANYDVIASEQVIYYPWSEGVEYRSQPDAILRRKQDGRIIILSIKTAKTLEQDDIDAHRISNQGNGEILAAEWWLNETYPGGTFPKGSRIHVDTYRMLFLLKGYLQKETEWINGQERLLYKYHNNPLIHPWVAEGPAMEMNRYTGVYKYTCQEPHDHKWAKRGVCPGWKNHTLGKDWKRCDVWRPEHIGVERLIDILAEREPHVLQGMIVSPFEHQRNPAQLESWRRQISHQAREQERNMDLLKAGMEIGDPFEKLLDVRFPQHTKQCYGYRSPCPFLKLCWGDLLEGGPGVKASPEDRDLYRYRMDEDERGAEVSE